MSANGHAVVHDGKIIVATVSSTKRAAAVNGMVWIFNVKTAADSTEAAIFERWSILTAHQNISIEEVYIEVVPAKETVT